MRLRTMPENQAPCAACSLSCRMLVLLFCTVRKPALARVVRENFTQDTQWARSTHLTLTISPPGYLRTLTQGGFRQTCIMSELPESIGPNRPSNKSAREVGRSDR